jgi:3-oxoadipate enol-lactonase
MPAIKVGDINIYYEIHGEGEPLILIMGLGGDISRWFRIIPILSQRYQVIAFDNRGIGQSDKPDIPYTMEMMANDIAGLLKALGIDTAHIFGISMGGMIAQHFVLRYPKMVTSLILGCTRCGGPHSIYENEGASRVLDPELTRTLTAEQRTREMLPFLWSQEFIANNPDIVKEQIELGASHPIDPVGYTRQKQAADGHNTYERLPEIKVPTLVITGEADRLIPSENSRILASRIPGAKLVLIKKAGHGFYSEATDETCGTIMDFMARNC